MLFRVLSGFKHKILCDIESKKKVGGGMGKEKAPAERVASGIKVWSNLETGQVIKRDEDVQWF